MPDEARVMKRQMVRMRVRVRARVRVRVRVRVICSKRQMVPLSCQVIVPSHPLSRPSLPFHN